MKTLTLEQLRSRLTQHEKHYADLAAKARKDFENQVASMERTRLLAEQTKAEQARRDALRAHSSDRISRLEKKAATDPRIACGLHLLDLKRAGHSPKQTEYTMVVDGQHMPVSIPIATRFSPTGSPAAMCEVA